MWRALPIVAWVAISAASSRTPAHAAPDDEGAIPPADVGAAPPAAHAWATTHLDLGFGLPTGMLGVSFEARAAFVSFEAGVGVGIGGPQLMAHVWAHLLRADSVGDLALGVGYSTGPVESAGELGDTFGPEVHYDHAHWLNLVVAPSLKAFVPTSSGPLARFLLGAMLNLEPVSRDSSRTLLLFGISIGWSWPL